MGKKKGEPKDFETNRRNGSYGCNKFGSEEEIKELKLLVQNMQEVTNYPLEYAIDREKTQRTMSCQTNCLYKNITTKPLSPLVVTMNGEPYKIVVTAKPTKCF